MHARDADPKKIGLEYTKQAAHPIGDARGLACDSRAALGWGDDGAGAAGGQTLLPALKVASMGQIPRFVNAFMCSTAVLAIPAGSAQEVAEACVAAGVRRLINYAPVELEGLPAEVEVANVWKQTTRLADVVAEVGGGADDAASASGDATTAKSRYSNDFHELRHVGRGGFGKHPATPHILPFGGEY